MALLLVIQKIQLIQPKVLCRIRARLNEQIFFIRRFPRSRFAQIQETKICGNLRNVWTFSDQTRFTGLKLDFRNPNPVNPVNPV
jgi:hypothetical protein